MKYRLFPDIYIEVVQVAAEEIEMYTHNLNEQISNKEKAIYG
jgi:hypothetical protein